VITLPDVPTQREPSPETFQRIARWMAAARDALHELGDAPVWRNVTSAMCVAAGGGWSLLSPVTYWKDTVGRVWVRGAVTGGAIPGTAFTLPYKPPIQANFAVISPTVSGCGSLSVHTNGDIVVNSGLNGYISLDFVYWTV
jgi:hypothetical protein